MDVQTLIFIFVGATFALYIGIAILAPAGNTDDFMSPEEEFPHSPMAWPQPLFGCRPLHSSPWLESFLLFAVMELFT